MASQPAVKKRRGRERLMGKVFADITIVNGDDDALQAHGLLAAGQVRMVHLAEVLVDTGATGLSLPADVIEQLGLRQFEEVLVETATGPAVARRFRNAVLTVEGRAGTFDCLELPGGRSALLGVVPMETLGLEPDLANERLRLLPMTREDTYITIL